MGITRTGALANAWPRYADMAVRQDSRTFQALFLVLAARGLRAVRASIGRNIVTKRTDIR